MSLDLVFPHTFVPWFRAVAPHIHAYHGKTWLDFERQGQPSKWVTLRACRVLRAVAMAEEQPR